MHFRSMLTVGSMALVLSACASSNCPEAPSCSSTSTCSATVEAPATTTKPAPASTAPTAAAPVAAVPASNPIVPPTAEDQQLAEQWEKVLATAPTAARESINHSREPWQKSMLAQLKGNAPATENQLAIARDYYKNGIKNIDLARDFPLPPNLVIHRAAAPVNIDGKGDESSWQNATALPITYTFANKNAIQSPAPATAKLLWDDNFLYAFFDVKDPNLVSSYTKRDDQVSQGTCVELFVNSSQRWGQYWEFNIAPTGIVFDSFYNKNLNRWGGDARPEEDVQGLKIGTTVRGTLNKTDDVDEGYTVEMAIPWSEIPGMARPRAGDHFFLLAGQAVKIPGASDKPPRFLSHLPIMAWFHNIWAYSQATLDQ
jgi:hypothetical protein